MGSSYPRIKFSFDASRSFSSWVFPKTQISHHTTKFSQSACKGPNFYGFSSYSVLSHRLGLRFGANRNLSNIYLSGGRRFYSAGRHNVQHFSKWFQDPWDVLIVVMVGSGILVVVYFGKLETVPYSKRTHFIILSKSWERRLGNIVFMKMKAKFWWKILPATHPESIRVRMIAENIIHALQKGLRKEQMCTDLGNASDHMMVVHEGNVRETMNALSETKGEFEEEWSREDEILDDKWIEKSRMKGEKKGSQAATSHLDGLNWEVLVVNKPIMNAFCLPGGKIIVFTGLLEHFSSDAEIATILGHEVGHAVARHHAEAMTKDLWFVILQLILLEFFNPNVVNKMSKLFYVLPFSRKMEMEADYIGLLLVASAGYDPRVVPTVYEKFAKITRESALKSTLKDYLSTHPSGKKRAKLLAQAHVMEEALTIYKNERASHGVEGFL